MKFPMKKTPNNAQNPKHPLQGGLMRSRDPVSAGLMPCTSSGSHQSCKLQCSSHWSVHARARAGEYHRHKLIRVAHACDGKTVSAHLQTVSSILALSTGSAKVPT